MLPSVDILLGSYPTAVTYFKVRNSTAKTAFIPLIYMVFYNYYFITNILYKVTRPAFGETVPIFPISSAEYWTYIFKECTFCHLHQKVIYNVCKHRYEQSVHWILSLQCYYTDSRWSILLYVFVIQHKFCDVLRWILSI